MLVAATEEQYDDDDNYVGVVNLVASCGSCSINS